MKIPLTKVAWIIHQQCRGEEAGEGREDAGLRSSGNCIGAILGAVGSVSLGPRTSLGGIDARGGCWAPS